MVRFKCRTLAYFLILLSGSTSISVAQTRGTVTGTALDRSTGQPVSGAVVILRGTQFRTITSATGAFEFVGIPSATFAMVVRHPRFLEYVRRDLVIQADQATTAEVQLDPIVLPLQELVASGTLDPAPALLQPFSVARLGARELQTSSGGSLMTALAGKIAGLSVLGQASTLGPGFSTQFRSNKQDGANPLIVIDGVILGSTAEDDLDIDPAEVESIEVLKGPAATAVYGTRGEAGVIVIETMGGRRALPGETRVDYRMETTLERLGRFMPTSRYHSYLMNAAGTQTVDTTGAPVDWSHRVFDRNHPFADRPYPVPVYDNIQALFPPSHGFRQHATLSRNGEKAAVSLTLGRIDQGGAMIENDGFTENRARFGLDYHLGDRLAIQVDAFYNSVQHDPLVIQPFVVAWIADPSISLTGKGPDGRYEDQDYPPYGNPVRFEAETDDVGQHERTRGSTRARYSPSEWISFDAQFGYDRSDGESRARFDLIPTQSLFSDSVMKAYNGTLGATVRGNRGGLDWQARIGAGLARVERRASSGSGELPSQSQWSETDFRDYAFNAGADYDQRYFIDAAVRYDDVSNWGNSARWQTHYRAGIAYRISGEPWFSFPGVNDVILRYAWGALSGHSVPGDLGILGVPVSGPPLERPRFSEHELGLTSVLLNERLSLALTYTRQSARDLIHVVPTLQGGFFDTELRNAVGMNGSALEATLLARLVDHEDLAIDLAVVGSRITNQTNLNRSCLAEGELRPATYICDGEQRGDFWGRRFLKSGNELPTALASRASEFQVNDDGYLVWVGAGNSYRDGISKGLWGTSTVVNGQTYGWGLPILRLDGTGSSFWHLGSSLPDFTYGFTTSARWKTLSATAELRGQLGGHVFNSARYQLLRFQRHGDIDQAGRLDELKKPISYFQELVRHQTAEPFIEDGTYLKLGALSARVNLARRHLARLGTMAPAGITVGLTARNLLTLSGYSGLDPEAGSPLARIESGEYPSFRAFGLTIDIRY
jgi:TonB-dependent SusC/RagA subfamily outer membrane receptor